MPANAAGTIACTVELYGVARLAAGRKAVPLILPAGATLVDVVDGLARVCPQLAGKGIAPDGSGLMDGYVLNVNGISFADSLGTRIEPGDAILLLMADSGG